MNRKKRIMLGIIGGIVIVIVTGVIAVQHNLSNRNKQAIQIAQTYLAQQYAQEMKYESIRFSWIDPAIYHVGFSPVGNPDLKFEVIVQQDLILHEANIVGKWQYMPDDYSIAYFELEMAHFIENDLIKIWDDDVSTYVSTHNPALYAFGVPVGLNDRLSLHDMEALIEYYTIFVTTERFLNEDNKLDEAKRILSFIQMIQDSGYSPKGLVIWYKAPKTAKNTSGRINISFGNWQEMTTINQVAEHMDDQQIAHNQR